MLKTILTAFVFPLFLLFGSTVIGSSHTEKSAAGQSMSKRLLKASRRIDGGDRCAKLVAGH